jgi:hypothetical protein
MRHGGGVLASQRLNFHDISTKKVSCLRRQQLLADRGRLPKCLGRVTVKLQKPASHVCGVIGFAPSGYVPP